MPASRLPKILVFMTQEFRRNWQNSENNPSIAAYIGQQAAPCGRGNPDCFVFRGGDAGGREN